MTELMFPHYHTLTQIKSPGIYRAIYVFKTLTMHFIWQYSPEVLAATPNLKSGTLMPRLDL